MESTERIAYYFKPSKVKGMVYMQIWKKEGNKDEYILSLGNAEKCYQKLVNRSIPKEQTNENGEKAD